MSEEIFNTREHDIELLIIVELYIWCSCRKTRFRFLDTRTPELTSNLQLISWRSWIFSLSLTSSYGPWINVRWSDYSYCNAFDFSTSHNTIVFVRSVYFTARSITWCVTSHVCPFPRITSFCLWIYWSSVSAARQGYFSDGLRKISIKPNLRYVISSREKRIVLSSKLAFSMKDSEIPLDSLSSLLL